MIIIWGSRNRQERLGEVADWCGQCQQVQAFTVTNYFRVGHIYYIPLGRGTFLGTTYRCWECGSVFNCDEEDFDDFLSEEAAQDLPMSELLARTNRRLQRRLERGRRESSAPRVYDALPADDDEPDS